ncbi:MAG: LUD domain-containing protein [Bacteroidota bacterium]
MEESTSKEKVLKSIRNALINVAENPFPQVDFTKAIFKEFEDSLDVSFATEFTRVGGKFVYCEDEDDFIQSYRILSEQSEWPPAFCLDDRVTKMLKRGQIPYSSTEDDFLKMKIGITACENLISRLGSIMVSSRQSSGRRMNVFPEMHIVVAYTYQLVPDLKNAFANLSNKYGKRLPSMISIITGPSRTADIEKTLVMGAHGPRELYLFLIDQTE